MVRTFLPPFVLTLPIKYTVELTGVPRGYKRICNETYTDTLTKAYL